MLAVHFTICHGFVLFLADLRRVLADLSRDSGRWWLENPRPRDPPVAPSTAWTIQVFASKAGPDQVTDEVSFRVPVTSMTSAPGEEYMPMARRRPTTKGPK